MSKKEYFKGFWEDGAGKLYCKPDYEDGHRHIYYYEEGETYEMPASEIELCNEGYHFSTDIKSLLIYYPRLQNMKIHKVKVGGKVILDDRMNKGVCSKITILEEVKIDREAIYSQGYNNSYQLFEAYGVNESKFVSGGKGVHLSENVLNSEGVGASRGIHYSSSVETSTCIQKSSSIYHCNRILDSECISQSNDVKYSRVIAKSKGVNRSNNCIQVIGAEGCSNVFKSFYVKDCINAEYMIMSKDIRNDSYYIFNKKVKESRFDRVVNKFMDFQLECGENIHPEFVRLCDNKWIVDGIPTRLSYWNLFRYTKGLFNLIRRLKEFDWKVFESITTLDEGAMKECIYGKED